MGLEVLVNDKRAMGYFEALMREFKLSGRVVIRP